MNYAEIKAAEARGKQSRVRDSRIPHVSGIQTPCWKCGAELGPMRDGDVTMCTACGEWHRTREVDNGSVYTWATSRLAVAALAREVMTGDPERLFWAMNKSAQSMRQESSPRSRLGNADEMLRIPSQHG